MKNQKRQLFIILLFLVSITEILFMGCGGGNSNSSDKTDLLSSTRFSETSAKTDGTFEVPVIKSENSSVKAYSTEKDTISNDSKIVLSARSATSQDKGLPGQNNNAIYKLTATISNDSSLLSSKQEISTVEKPIVIQIEEKFPANTSEFYLGTRSDPDADWQYSKLNYDFSTNTFKNNTAQSHSFASSRMAVTTDTVNYTFSITTYRLGREITIFYDSTGAAGTLATSTPSINSITRMTFATNLPYLDLKINENGDYAYNSDLIITTCLESTKSGAIFNGASATTIITFLTDSSSIIGSLEVVGNSTKYADQYVSPTRDGAGNKYTHRITFNDYPFPSKTGKMATYTFTLKLRNKLLAEFPETFLIKTIFTDTTPITYNAESSLTREKYLSYLSAVSPAITDGKVSVGSNLVMKYVGHDIASLTVTYAYDGLSGFTMPGAFTKDPANNTLTFHPALPWPSNKSLTVSATAFCCPTHKKISSKNCQFSFATKDIGTDPITVGTETYQPVTVSMTSPSPTTSVDPSGNIVLQFSDPIAWNDSFAPAVKVSSGSHPLAVATPTFDAGAKTITFKPIEGLKYNTNYIVVLEYIADAINKKFINKSSFTFSTKDGIHSKASIKPTPASVIDGNTLVKPTFIVDFGKAISKSTYINQNLIQYAFESIKVYEGINIVPIGNLTKQWLVPYKEMELSFKTALKPNTTYTIKMEGDIRDFENIPIDPFSPYNFTVLPEIGTTLIIPNPTTNVDINTNLEIKFSKNIDWIATYSKKILLLNNKIEVPTQNYVYDGSTQTLTFQPNAPLLYNTKYAVEITPGLYNQATMQYIASNSLPFETADTAHLKAKVTLPDTSKIGSSAILKPTLIIDFGATVINENGAKASISLKKNGVEISNASAPIWENTFQILKLTYNLEPNSEYTISMNKEIKAIDGRIIDPFADLTFNTVPSIKAKLTTPAATTDAEVTNHLVLTFSDDIAWTNSENDRNKFYFYQGKTNISSSLTDFTYATAPRTLTITTNQILHNASYALEIGKGLINPITNQPIDTARFTFATKDGPHTKATAVFAAASLIDGKSILKPTISVDFGKKVIKDSTAEDAIRLYKKTPTGEVLTAGYIAKWQNDYSKADLVFTTALYPNTKYALRMNNSVPDYEGIPIEPFDEIEFTTMPDITAELIEPADHNNAPTNTKLIFKFSNGITWNESSDSEKILVQLKTQKIPIKEYTYSETDKTLTISLKDELLHNDSYTIRILNGIKNNTTSQSLASTTVTIKTIDGAHTKAKAEIDANSINIDGTGAKYALLKPTIYVELAKDVLNADLAKIRNAIKLFKGTSEITGIYKTWEAEYNKLKITFADSLEGETSYKLTMEEGVRDLQGIYIDPFDDLEFTTQKAIGINLISPTNTAAAPLESEIKVKFTEPIDWVDYYKNKVSFKIGETILGFDKDNGFIFDPATNILTIKPAKPLLHNTIYTLAFKAGIANNTTKQQTTATAFEFTTCDGAHSQAVLIVSEADKINELLTPQDNQDGVEDILLVTPNFVVDFCKTVGNELTAENSIKIFADNKDVTVTSKVTKSWIGNKKQQLQLSFESPNMLDSDTIYQIKMINSLKDDKGAVIEPFETYTFKTTPNGTGTESNPYHIYTAAQLDNIRNNMRCFYVLKKDINLATATYLSPTNTVDKGWLPIGDPNSSFGDSYTNQEGKRAAGLDGNGHTISGLTINRPTSPKSVGLFGYAVNAKFTRILFEDTAILGEEAVGCLVGMATSCEISLCATSDTCKTTGVSYVGGICGNCYSTTIDKCRNSAKVSSTAKTGDYCGTGGITGWNNYRSRISCCYNDGIIIAVERPCGGIAGYNNAIVSNCCNDKSAHIESYTHSGGIVGINANNATVDHCIAFGNIYVTNLDSEKIGGIVGYTELNATVSNNAITESTKLNGKACDKKEETVFNYEKDSERIVNNHCFGSLTDLFSGVSAPDLWKDNEYFDSRLWSFSTDNYPELKNLP